MDGPGKEPSTSSDSSDLSEEDDGPEEMLIPEPGTCVWNTGKTSTLNLTCKLLINAFLRSEAVQDGKRLCHV